MPSDQARLDALQKAAAAANPLGFVAIQVSDLRWLLELIQSGGPHRDGDVVTSPLSELKNLELPDAAEHN